MLDLKDFTFGEGQNIFDFKGFLLKIIGYWKWIVACVILFVFIAYQVNIRKEKVYALNSLIMVKDESSPLLTSNTSLVFNWGGVSEKVQSVIEVLKSRTHNELVVEQLKYYIDYLEKDKYYYRDIYGKEPFNVILDRNAPQLLEQYIKVKLLSDKEYELSVSFEEESKTIIYTTDEVEGFNAEKGIYKKTFLIGQEVRLPFLNWRLELSKHYKNSNIGKEFYVKLNNFNNTVVRYQDMSVETTSREAGSILKLQLKGTNKNRIVEYLNTTVELLRSNQLQSKNQFAINTIRFIDSTLAKLHEQNAKTSSDLANYMKDKSAYEISNSGEGILIGKLSEYDIQKETILRKIEYYKTLERYLNTSTDFSELPAPTVAGIEDENIRINVAKLIESSIQRSQTTFGYKNENRFKQIDSGMEAIKLVLLENIASARLALDYDLKLVDSKITELEAGIRQLPLDKQEQTEILRKYDLEQQFLGVFMSKRSEAEIMKASSLSDVHFIDKAKDIGEGLIGPKTSINYILAVFLGTLIPVLILLLIFVLDSSVKTIEDVVRLSKVPVIGTLAKRHRAISNMAILESPKSALAESFRSVRSSLQFMYKKNKIVGSKVLMVTSSISGEGKTFCSLNLATVFALGEKKTIIIGFDLRKPRLAENLKVKKDIGIVNYLIGQKNIDEIIQPTEVPYLDTIVSGTVPPNPSELIMGDQLDSFFEELQKRYDYIILDTPPVGLVTDAMELVQYCDAVLYVVRQNITKKSMLSIVNEKYRTGELSNVSLLLNGFENKAKYGYSYGYGYGYEEYGESSGYYEEPKRKLFMQRISKIFRK